MKSAWVLLVAVAGWGQVVAGFDVAATRRSLADEHARSHIVSDPADGRFQAVNVPLIVLLRFAFGVPETRILGAPDWVSAEKYDMEARSDAAVDERLKGMDSAAARGLKQTMLQALFAERFGLKWHEETRELPVYRLVVAKGGSKLAEAKGGQTIDEYRTKYVAQGIPVSVLAEELAKVTGRVVEDETALPGRYDVSLRWSADDAQDTTVPGIFGAVTEQLGLKLESGKGPVKVVVVDAVARPTVN